MPTPYLDFEIEIGPGDGRTYPVAVLRSPAGEAKAELTWPFSQLQLENRLLTLQNALLRSGGQKRRALTQEEQTVQEFGAALFNVLFAGVVGNLYYESRRMAVQAGTGLRIKLRLDDPGLATLPWGYLYDTRMAEYLSRSSTSPLVRYLSLSHPVYPLKIQPPLRILAMMASPEGMEPLDVARERQRMERGLAALVVKGLVELVWLEGQTWQDLRRAMRQETWHIFHFVGHGGFDEIRREGLIILADKSGNPRGVTAAQLAQVLRDHHSLRLAVFNSCEGARADKQDIFSSTATTLVRAGIPAVLAMQYEITDAAAMQFAETFYETLAEGVPIDTAVVEARIAISMEVTNSLEWGTPVLFMRSSDGVIFDLEQTLPRLSVPAQVRTPTPKPEPPKPKFPIDFDWVEIPAGEFTMGSVHAEGIRIGSEEKPQHILNLLSYSIARIPVTNVQYKAFVDATGYEMPMHWENARVPSDKEDHPVVNVSWHDALTYCCWAGVRLPSEAEWEKAARGTDGRLWPWGNDRPTRDHCNFNGNKGDTTSVWAYPKGVSPYGVQDLAGNVLEWTSSLKMFYPYDADDGREDPETESDPILRGGAFAHEGDFVRCAFRGSSESQERYLNVGFRVASFHS